MSQDPFFRYFIDNRETLSQQMHRRRNTYKRYSRFPQIPLPQPEFIHNSLSDLLLERRSRKEYGTRSITLQEISTFFFWSAGILKKSDDQKDNKELRGHPSGGGKYPIELYVLILKDGVIRRGVYHYSIETHALEHLITVDLDTLLKQFAPFDNFSLKGEMIVLFSFMKNRSFEKYGALAYKLAFIESGHIGQNMYFLSVCLGLSCCSMGLNNATNLDIVLRLDKENESVFYGIVIGAKQV